MRQPRSVLSTSKETCEPVSRLGDRGFFVFVVHVGHLLSLIPVFYRWAIFSAHPQPSNGLPTPNLAFQRLSSGYAGALPTGFRRLPTVCVPTPHTPRGVGSARATRTPRLPPLATAGAYARAKVAPEIVT